MLPSSTITFLLILINLIVSYRGFRDASFLSRYLFRVDRILVNKEYIRLISSGFLHIGWMHLVFNMITLYFFGASLELFLGPVPFLLVYLAGILGGNLLSLFLHRFHGDYSAIGASGAVCGVIFATIALFPGMSINFFFVPIPIAGWLYGLVFILYSIYGVRSGTDNIGHEAHLGGALTGMLAALAFEPEAFRDNFFTIGLITIPIIVFIYIIVSRPQILYVKNLYFTQHLPNATIDHRYNLAKTLEKKEIDRILEKIHKKGMSSLSKEEKQHLDEYSKNG
jgi:membrane associated rhomboid family serine protease